jgi:tRNA (cmo5U34)-methyltransferase
MEEKKDNVYAEPLSEIVDFKFDEKVANVFEDMLRRSIPGYAASITAIGLIAKRFFREGTNCYDLGSSLGASALSLSKSLAGRKGKIYAIDNSRDMIERSREFIARNDGGMRVELVCADISDVKIKNASIVVLNYTLQFISPEKRETLLRNIYNGLTKGGVLIVSEKIKHENAEEQEIMTELYHDFKEYNGYSRMEISRKRDALENVLIPETISRHKERAERIGFEKFYLWYKYFTFVSYFLIK